MRVRLAGILPIEDGFAFMHRVGVQNHPIGDYYTFPGGGREGDETLEEGTIREIKEEVGIDVEVEKSTALIGNARLLDSMGLVNVLVDTNGYQDYPHLRTMLLQKIEHALGNRLKVKGVDSICIK